MSLMTVVAFVGSPSVVAACAALCWGGDAVDTPGMHGSAHERASEAPEHENTPHHHMVSRGDEPTHAPPLQMTASGRDCCAHALRAAAPTDAALRGDTLRYLATASILTTPADSPISFCASPGPGFTIPPPSPPRAPLVLLI